MADHQYQFLLSDGRWAVDNIPMATTLVLHNYANTEEIDAIRQFVPKRAVERLTAIGIAEPLAVVGDVPLEISAPVIQKIKQLSQDAAAFYRLHVDTLDNIYDLLADETKYINMSFIDLVKQLFGRDLSEMSHGAQMAIFSALQKDQVKTQSIRALAEEMYVVMTPKGLLRKFEKVTNWARQYQEAAAQAALGKGVSTTLEQNPLNHFIEKARKLIIRSRKIRSPTTIGVLGPTSGSINHEGPIELRETGETYTENDKMILEFLWNTYLRLPMMRHKNQNHSIGSLILRAIGAYPTLRLERKIGRLLLQELGSLAPWSETMDESTTTPVPGRRGAHIADQLHEESEKLATDLGFDERPNQIPMTDTMAHLRKDWGDTEVLCIDKPSAKVLDDGISLEPATDMPGAYWIHVHIAHPSAFITPEHLFARRGRHFGASLYTSRMSYQMLPASFAQTLSLGPQKPVLTVSSLLLPDGEVKEVKVSVGIINKVTRLDPAAVDRVLGIIPNEKASMTIGLDMIPPIELSEDAVEVARRHIEALQTVQNLCFARIKHRQQQVPECANWEISVVDVDVAVSFLEPYDTERLTRNYHYLGDPTIKIESDRFLGVHKVGERQFANPLTAQVMILASESAGRWFREHDIPAVYNGSLTHPEYPLSRLNKIGPHEMRLMPRVTATSYPVPHVMLTVSQYSRVTSPLRRYPDLLGQWQMDAFLQAQASSHVESGHTGSARQLPFTASMIDEYIATQQRVVSDIDRLMRKSQVHWTFQGLFRAFHFKAAALPEVWDMRIESIVQQSDPDDSMLRGKIYPFSIAAALLTSKEGWEKSAQFMQYLPVKIELVDVDRQRVDVRAVGPPSNVPTQTDPIHIASTPDNLSAKSAPAIPRSKWQNPEK
jgi:RNB domain